MPEGRASSIQMLHLPVAVLGSRFNQAPLKSLLMLVERTAFHLRDLVWYEYFMEISFGRLCRLMTFSILHASDSVDHVELEEWLDVSQHLGSAATTRL